MDTFLVPDGRGGCGQLAQAGCPIRPWHRVYAPAAGEGTSLAWASPGLGLEMDGREMWLPEDEAGLAISAARFGGFDEDPLPRWRWRVGETLIEAILAPQHGEPAVALRVCVSGARPGTRLLFRPAFTPWGPVAGQPAAGAPPAVTGELPVAAPEPAMGIVAGEAPGSLQAWRTGDRARFEVLHPEAKRVRGPAWDRRHHGSGWWFRPGGLALALPPGESTRDFRVGLDCAAPAEAAEILETGARRIAAVPRAPGLDSPAAGALSRALDRYRIRPRGRGFALLDRLPADGPPDPGAVWRSLPGTLLAFGMLDEAREVLRAGADPAAAVRGPADSKRSGADEPSWEWVLAGHHFAQVAGDLGFVRSELWPSWMRLARGVAAPEPGPSGAGSLRLASARHAALRAMAAWAPLLEQEADAGALGHAVEMAASAARAHYDPLRAALTERLGAGPDARLTAAGLLALDAPFPFLDPAEEKGVLGSARELLWTPAGIRVVEPPGAPGPGDVPLALPALLGPWLRAERRLGADRGALDARLEAARTFAVGALAGPVRGHVCPVRQAEAPHAPAASLDSDEVERADLEADTATLSICA
ncbi:MAG: glycogen debranching enzyme N-terminal domain-containing protein [Candidatus Eisenbacteria bacterium]|nr:glycogen debranching enzyme N-terminal domain-containing protein [Candidatus Eisenbacteria bacterium]